MKEECIKGIKQALPVVLGYLPIGFAFGILAVQQGLSLTDVFFMSLMVYAGSSQFIAAAMLAADAAVYSIIATTFLVNLRHLLMSASLSPYLKHIPTPVLALISHGITDETFAVGITHASSEKATAGYFAALHVTSQSAWIISTVMGAVLAGMIADTAQWGLDFALPAMFIGLLLMQLKERKHIFVSLCAALISLTLAVFFKGNWNIIIAALSAATIGVCIEQWTQK